MIWKVDTAHSNVFFKTKYLMLTYVSGSFTNYTAEVETINKDFSTVTAINFSAAVNSIQTNNKARDLHLKSDVFFDAARYATLTFKSSSFIPYNEKHDIPVAPYFKYYELTGDLTIKGITKNVVFQAAYEGTTTDPIRGVVAGFTLLGIILREDFELNWGDSNKAGRLILDSQIKISCDLQLIKQS